MRLKLLPDDPELGWVPYVWLAYLSGFVVDLLRPGTPVWEWVISIVALPPFLVLYFLGYWVTDARRVWVAAAIAALGAVFMPLNFGGGGFFIYAAAFLGDTVPQRAALRRVLAVVVFSALEIWLLDVSLVLLYAPVVSLMIGGVNIHFSEVSRNNALLRQARSETEHMARVAERERIARDLHDLLGHTLSVIVLKSELASKLADRDAARAINEIREVEAISRKALAEVRSAVLGYRSQGLTVELDAARKALESAGVELNASLDAGPVSTTQEGLLALVLREGVTNVIRHAGARRCWVELGRENGSLHLEVRDDGRGSQGAEGTGLRGMRERLRALGGSLETDGREGMRIRATLPVRGDTSSEAPA